MTDIASPVPGVTLKTTSANGIHMRYAEIGSGPLVLFCHGWPESWYSWRHQLEAVSRAGFRAVAPDMRGYGGTEAPEGIDQYTLMHLVGDMAELVKALGETKAIIVGHDWGAPVAWNAAQWRPDVFRAVAALSVPVAHRTPIAPTAAMRAMFGDAFFYIVSSVTGRPCLVHVIRNANTRTSTNLRNPNLYLTWESRNTGTAASVTARGASGGEIGRAHV